MNPPILSFRSNDSPYSTLTTLTFSQTKDSGGPVLPVLQGEKSDYQYFRIYNNWGLSSSIATAQNVRVTTFDGIGSVSRTALTAPVSQCWIRVFENGYGENSTTPGLLTSYDGTDTAVGGLLNLYTIEKGSDGSISGNIRAGSDTNGVGFIKIKTYAELPTSVTASTFLFAIAVEYEYVL